MSGEGPRPNAGQKAETARTPRHGGRGENGTPAGQAEPKGSTWGGRTRGGGGGGGRASESPGYALSVSFDVNGLRANIGCEYRYENDEPRADEDQACDDVGGPMHTQLNP
jgi:hypothetical protein